MWNDGAANNNNDWNTTATNDANAGTATNTWEATNNNDPSNAGGGNSWDYNNNNNNSNNNNTSGNTWDNPPGSEPPAGDATNVTPGIPGSWDPVDPVGPRPAWGDPSMAQSTGGAAENW